MSYAETREEHENSAKEEMILQHLKCCNSSFDLELDSEIDSISLEDHKNYELPPNLENRNRHENEDEIHTDDEIGKMRRVKIFKCYLEPSADKMKRRVKIEVFPYFNPKCTRAVPY